MMRDSLEQARHILAESTRALVVTGAGISAESGIPTFRDAMTGYYSKFDPMKLASPQGFQEDPKLVWEWYAERIRKLSSIQPNPGHHALVQLEQRLSGFLLMTQNVDGLHQRAGSQNVQELHGNLTTIQCFETGRICDPGEVEVTEPFPLMTRDGTLARPGVVWFGEMLPTEPFLVMEEFFRLGKVDVCLVIGTSAQFYYVQSMALLTKQQGGLFIEINREETELSSAADLVLRGKAGEILPQIISTQMKTG